MMFPLSFLLQFPGHPVLTRIPCLQPVKISRQMTGNRKLTGKTPSLLFSQINKIANPKYPLPDRLRLRLRHLHLCRKGSPLRRILLRDLYRQPPTPLPDHLHRLLYPLLQDPGHRHRHRHHQLQDKRTGHRLHHPRDKRPGHRHRLLALVPSDRPMEIRNPRLEYLCINSPLPDHLHLLLALVQW